MGLKRKAKNTIMFSSVKLKNIKAPSKGRIFYYDANFPGLRLQVLPSGTKSFQLEKYSSAAKGNLLKTLGKFDQMTYAEAKKLAKDLSARIAKGEDLRNKTLKKAELEREKDERDSITVADFSKIFIKGYRKRNGERKKSSEQDQKYFQKAINPVIGGMALKRVAKIDVLRVLKRYDKDGHRISGNRCLACLSTAMEWAVEKDYLSVNPCKHVSKLIKQETSRDRVLSKEEIGRLWQSLDDSLTSQLIRFLIITGQRSGEVRNMRWTEVSTVDGVRVWTIPGENTKNGDSNIVPLSRMAIQLLESLNTETEFVFQGVNGPLGKSAARQKFNRLIRDWGWQSATLHDLRRTFRTYLGELGVYDEIAEGLMNHRLGRIQRTYNRSLRLEQKKEAMNLWSDNLIEMISCGEKLVVS